jgi:hypothetical protein
MNGVTTAILSFIFLSLAFPTLIKRKTQFYIALVAVLVVILLDSLAHMVPALSFQAFAYTMAGLTQIVAVLMLVMASGGLSASDLRGEISGAIEVVRRGESGKEVLIPLTESAKRKMNAQAQAAEKPRRNQDDPADHKVYTLDETQPSGSPQTPVADPGPLPLE